MPLESKIIKANKSVASLETAIHEFLNGVDILNVRSLQELAELSHTDISIARERLIDERDHRWVLLARSRGEIPDAGYVYPVDNEFSQPSELYQESPDGMMPITSSRFLSVSKSPVGMKNLTFCYAHIRENKKKGHDLILLTPKIDVEMISDLVRNEFLTLSSYYMRLGAIVSEELEMWERVYPYEGRILLVEEKDYLRNVFRDTLQARGWKVTTADSRKVAVQKAKEGNFELALVDWKIPPEIGQRASTQQGEEVIDTLVRYKRKMPIVLMSGYEGPSDALGLVRNKGVQLIANNKSPKEITDFVESILESREYNGPLVRQPYKESESLILILDDDSRVGEILETRLGLLKKRGEDNPLKDFNLKPMCTVSVAEAIKKVSEYDISVLVVDQKLEGARGIDFGKLIKRVRPYTQVILYSGVEIGTSDLEEVSKIGKFVEKGDKNEEKLWSALVDVLGQREEAINTSLSAKDEGILYVIAGVKSGGKTTFVRAVNLALPFTEIVPKYLTRAPKENEITGVEKVNVQEKFIFLTDNEFENRNGFFDFVYSHYGYKGGIRKKDIDRILKSGKDAILHVNDPEVVVQLKELYKERAYCCLVRSPWEVVRSRLEERRFTDYASLGNMSDNTTWDSFVNEVKVVHEQFEEAANSMGLYNQILVNIGSYRQDLRIMGFPHSGKVNEQELAKTFLSLQAVIERMIMVRDPEWYVRTQAPFSAQQGVL